MTVDRPEHVKARRLAACAVLLVSSAGCSEPTPTADPGADAVVYVEAYCSELCDKAETCGPLPEANWDCADYDECYDTLLRRLEEESCMAYQIEFGRCLAERETCEEYVDLQIQTSPGSVCFDRWVPLAECVDQHADEYR